MENSSHVLSASGSITKKELLRSYKNKALADYLVLESIDPFPQVEHKPKSNLPRYYYVAVDSSYLDHDVIHTARHVEQELHEELNAAVGEIFMDSSHFLVIRLKNIPSKLLVQVVNGYKESGMKLSGFEKHVNDPAIIHIRKFFYLEEVLDGFYFDLDEGEIGYFEIPTTLEWKDFYQLTDEVKKENPGVSFDGATGNFTKHGVATNIIRIYSPVLDQDTLLKLGKSYLKHLSA